MFLYLFLFISYFTQFQLVTIPVEINNSSIENVINKVDDTSESSQLGITSFILATINILITLVGFFIPIVLIVSSILCIISIILGFRSLKKEKNNRRYAVFGLIISFVLCALLITFLILFLKPRSIEE